MKRDRERGRDAFIWGEKHERDGLRGKGGQASLSESRRDPAVIHLTCATKELSHGYVNPHKAFMSQAVVSLSPKGTVRE